MNDYNDVNEIVEIDFEVGHVSVIREKPTTVHSSSHTHEWKVYFRSAYVHGNLDGLIERCVFHLHPEYLNNKREVTCSPFTITESGYAGFHLPIDIYFKTKKQPKKFRIEYDLDLHANVNGQPFQQKESYVRRYRCAFYNPTPEFRQKILAAGGKIVTNDRAILNYSDTDESDMDHQEVPPYEPTTRHLSQQIRSLSLASTANVNDDEKN